MTLKESTRRAFKLVRFFRLFVTTKMYLVDKRERERCPIVSVGIDPTGTFRPQLATFDVYDQIIDDSHDEHNNGCRQVAMVI